MKNLIIDKINTLDKLNIALHIRKEVFIKEQNVSLEEEIDEYDKLDHDVVVHYLLYVENVAIGTIRIINTPEYVKIGRVAILKKYRKNGYGKYMIKKVIEDISKNNIFNIKDKYFYLEAQIQALKFYHTLDFEEYGDIFLDANIEHIKMKRVIDF